MTPRSALVVKLKHTVSDREFFFMVNHLYQGTGVDHRRLDQAKKLREWAEQQTLPVIAVGDYNFDYDLDPQDSQYNYQKGLGDMVAGSIFKWLTPGTWTFGEWSTRSCKATCIR